MADVHKSLRLGDLLVEKGLITRLQLREAIEVQQNLLSQRFGTKNINVKTELGEILIELGFISRHQLQVNLNWQRRLKATTAIMVFIAPLLTAACGGGGGSASASTGMGNLNTNVSSSIAPSDAPPKPEPTPTPDPVSSTQPISSSSASSANSVPANTTSSAVLSSVNLSPRPISSNSSSSFIANSASAPSSQISSPALSSSSSQSVNGAVQLLWNIPTQRENGDYLDITEIGGYELRYKLKGDNEYKTVLIADGFTDAYYFDYLKGDYDFEIAIFDKDGLYSNFVTIDPS